jgi:ABC-type branched-subunit amino acid transport system substrate-binding protein
MSMGKHRRGNADVSTARLARGWRVIAALMLIVPLFAGVMGSHAAAQDEAGPLRIGALFPITGDLSDFGPRFMEAAQLAADEINAGGGVNGQPLELAPGDSATAPQQAVEEARRLIDLEGVSAIVGPAGSGETLPAVESVTGPGAIVQISPSATSPALTIANDDDFFFRTTLSDAAQGVVLGGLALELGYQTACVMYVNNAYGQGLNDVFVEAFTAGGGTVTAQVPHEQEQASYASELATCLADDPDVLVGPAYPESGRVFLRELVESGEAPAVLLTDGLKSPDMFEEIGWEPFEGSYGTAAGAFQSDVSAAFDTAWEAAYGDLPALPYLKEVYDAVYVIALAAEMADSVDGTAIRDALREVSTEPGTVVTPGTEGWQAAVAAIDAGEDIDYEGASGPIAFDENGDISQGLIDIWQIEGGEIVTEMTQEFDLTAGAAEASPEATPMA